MALQGLRQKLSRLVKLPVFPHTQTLVLTLLELTFPVNGLRRGDLQHELRHSAALLPDLVTTPPVGRNPDHHHQVWDQRAPLLAFRSRLVVQSQSRSDEHVIAPAEVPIESIVTATHRRLVPRGAVQHQSVRGRVGILKTPFPRSCHAGLRYQLARRCQIRLVSRSLHIARIPAREFRRRLRPSQSSAFGDAFLEPPKPLRPRLGRSMLVHPVIVRD